MKIVGTLDTRNDGDLLQAVLDQPLLQELDYFIVYNDGSTDNTEEILKKHRRVDYYVNQQSTNRRVFLLDTVKAWEKEQDEEMWVVRIEGDRFFINQGPEEIVERARADHREYAPGVMIDFRRSKAEGWGAADTWPNWDRPIQEIQTYCRIDDVHNAVAYKVTRNLTHENYLRPWPKGIKTPDYTEDVTLHKDMAFFAHHGRRSPKYWSWSYSTGNRKKPSKYPTWDFTTPAAAEATVGFPLQCDELVKWRGLDESFDELLALWRKEHER